MSLEKTTLEIIAPTTDEAIENGLKQLGLNEDQVDIEVLDSGSRGLLGIGGRQSRVRLTLKDQNQDAVVKPVTVVDQAGDHQVDISETKAVDESTLSDDEKQCMKVAKTVVVNYWSACA
jgi:spoIIIJ-associated protein